MSTDFSYSQIMVDDATAMTEFFSSVFGMRVMQRFTVDFGDPVEEVMLGSGESPAHVLVLVQVLDGRATVQGESMLGFTTDDFDAVLQQAIAHGAEVVKEPFRPTDSADLAGMERISIFKDPEGHACQIIELSAQAG